MNKPNRSVFITGGTGSVGRALIAAFCDAGHKVSFQYRSQDGLAKLLVKKHRCRAVQFDLSRDFSLEGEFDILVNNAGINLGKNLTAECSDEEFTETLNVNLVAPFRLTRRVLPRMKRRRWGRIINISSIYGLRAVEGNCPYTISKHGLSGLTKTVAKEYARYGITCNEICPGPIEGELMERIARRSFSPYYKTPQEYLAAVASELPAQRLAKPAEIAAMALFLASDRCQYVNGTSIAIDGGLIA